MILRWKIFTTAKRRGKLKEKWNDWKGSNSTEMCGQISAQNELRS
jgi:hypothetical protein